MRVLRAATLLSVFLSAQGLPAQGLPAQGDVTEVIPAIYTDTEASSQSAFPWTTNGAQRVMYAYDGSLLGIDRPVRLRGIAFRPDGGAATTFGPVTFNFVMHVSTSTRPATNLSRTFEANHGADKTRVHSGTRSFAATAIGTAPNEFVLYVPFTVPFTWNPGSGPLLIEIQSRGFASGSNPLAMDGSAAGEPVGCIAHRSSAASPTADFPASGTQNFALVAQLDLDYFVGPSSLTSVEGSVRTPFPWNHTVGSGMRVQYVYDTVSLFPRGRYQIHRLSFRPDQGSAFGGGTYDMKITLSTGAPNLSTAMSPTFANNTGPDAKVVFDGVLTAPASIGGGSPNGFDLEVPLMETFSHNRDQGSLVVDIQMRNVVQSGGANFDAALGTGSGSGFARVYDPTGGPNAISGSVQDVALAMAISGYPQPTLPKGEDVTSSNSSSPAPWHSTAPMRVMYAYGLGTVRLVQQHQITHLRWRPSQAPSFGPVTYDCTIDLSTGPRDPSTIGTVFDSNHGADRTRVFSGKFSIAYTPLGNFPNDWIVEVKLDRPFRWNPFQGSLLVDIRLLDAIAGGGMTALLDGSRGTHVHYVTHLSDPNATNANNGPLDFALDMSLGGEPCNGIAEHYGQGCVGGNGQPAIQTTSSLPRIPNPEFGYRLVQATPGSLAFLVAGGGSRFQSLTPLGAPTCFSYSTANIATFVRVIDGTGGAAVAVPVPLSPGLAGLRFYTMWGIVDPAANSLGLYTTAGMVTEFCYSGH